MAFSKTAENTTGKGIKLLLIGPHDRRLWAYCIRDKAKTAMSKTLILFDFSGITTTSLSSAPLQGISFANYRRGMKVNNPELKKSRRQESYIFVALILFLFSYGCAIFRGLSESEVPSEQSPSVVVYEQPTAPVVSDSPTPVKNENSRAVSSSKKALSKEAISQLQARLKAAGFDPGPIDGILGSKTRSLILRVQVGCTILNELASTNREPFAPAVETQVATLTGSANTLSKADIQLLQRRLKGAGFYSGPIDGMLGPTTSSALSRCNLGCTALNDISGMSDKPIFEQATELQSPRASAPAQPTAPVDTVSGNQEIRRAQERLKAAGFDPGPIDGKLGPQTKAALEKYRSSHKLIRSGSDGLPHY
jgi:peptidoglycan hydrolase-like protein with peptidoglycan-binding domain